MNVSFHYNVSTAQVQWSAGSGASSYSVRAVTKQGLSLTCNTINTDCVLTGLQCSQTYSITVTAKNQACDSQISDASLLMTEPCPPTNIQANVSCGQPTATVSWQQSDLAAGYVAYFDSQRGHDTFCVGTDTDTSCVVSGLMCGTVYSVWVKALGHQYNSSDSIVVPLTSGPCEPSNIEVIYDCGGSSANISWQPSDGAVLYITVLTASSGHTASCTTNQTSCQPKPLRCGEEYNVTVKAVGETCNSSSQMTGYLTTEPCVPTNVSIHYNLSAARVMWNTARGAASYSVQAVSGRNLTVTCNTTNTHCSLTALQCSRIYSIPVMTQSLACNNTVSSAPYRLVTEPCPPTNVQASMSCRQLTSTVSWEQSDLALGYVAYLDNQNGHYTSCMSTNTSCVVSGLMCGTVYSVWVKALGQQYNSSDSSVVSLTSAPCLPRDMTVEVNCTSDNAVLVSWNGTYGTTNISLMAVVGGSLQTLCTTQQESCNMTSLSCGETYSLSINASNDQCSLSTQTLSNFTTRPCPPQGVAANLHCSSRTAVLSWEERSNVELYTASAIKASGGEEKTCDSVTSTCQFSGLDCGEMYNFTVTAHNRGCCSQPSSPVFIHTEPCPPMNISAEVLCESDEVKISWQEASGAESFLVTVSGSDGLVKTHNTTQTLLRASLPCGQHFNVTVRGQGSACNGVPSSPTFFKTAPCIPRGLVTDAECGFDVGSVSWQPTDGAESYIAVATGLDGHAHRCVSNTTSCTWSDLHCGEEYSVVVRAKSNNCTSLPSNSSIIHMDPCAPQNLSATVNCDMKVVPLSWDASNGAKMYTVSAEAGNKSVSLNTNMTTASFTGFTCGQNYSIKITPHSRHCPGNSSASVSVLTWPCKPMGVSASQDCLTSIAVVTWQPSNGSDVYTATMQTDTGVSEMCMSDTNQCSFPGLMCGHNFSVSVTASNQQCNVTSGPATSLQSVPCLPTDVSVVMDCANNTAVVSWAASQGAVKYSVMAHSAHVNNDSCQTSGLSCNLNNLTCGSLYTVQVVAMGDSCSSVPSWPLKFNSIPCPPQNVSAQVSCSSNTLTVSWDAIGDADHFLVSLAAENGESELCNTTNTVCFSSNATCGKTFTVQVTSVREHCRSVHSQTQSIQSAPCQPQGINGSVDCVTNSAWISWLDAPGADSYTVSGVAVGRNDYRANCTTSTNTTCEMKDLACGVLYNFSVSAKNSECESQPSAPISLETAPCSLSAITAVPQCHNSSILVVWDLMEASKRNTVYTATAEASDYTLLTCNNTGTSCSLQEAQCGLHYTIIVAASSDTCSSMRSPPSRVSMEPCPPTDVRVNAACEHHRAVVSWTPSPVAETYHVVAEAADGHTHTCNTSSTNCSLSELHCDEQYTVFVTAGHENCSSKASQNITLNTGPCQPTGLSVTYQCSNQSAMLTWTPSGPAKDYYGCAQAGNGDMLYCHSTNPSCVINRLDCGTVYNFSVQASDGTCNSSFSDPVQIEAVPCPPAIAEVQLFPVQEEIQVMRFSWTQITCGDTEYMLTLTGSLLGDSQALFELSSYWTNVTYFEFPLPCSSNYSATMKSRNAAGMSDTSMPVYGTTAPCPPSGVVYTGNSSFATVSWNASVFAVNYTVYDNSITPKVQLCSTARLSCSLSNIASSDLAITASNAAGESEATNVTKMVTHARRRRDLQEQMSLNGSISAPVLDVTHTTSTVISITWSKVEGASYYSLLVIKQSRSHEHQQLTVYGESVMLTDMRPNATYCISVLAIYRDASGPESEPICVQTDSGLP
ncbi:unnamed protein product [Oreochromis niloticus]|nr:unnamed protein product [Mustela putorius furo]